MNEIMLPHSLSEDFSCSESKMDCIQTPPKLGNVDINHKTSSMCNYKIDIASEKGVKRGISESLSDDSIICNSHDIFGKLSKDVESQDAKNSSLDSDTSSAEYEIVSLNVENMTKTTVINATINLSTQLTVKNGEKNEFVQSMPSSYELSTGVDKSRVVVQVLTSNTENCVKTQTVVENKNALGQGSNIHSFRDDVFNILSKTKPKKCDNECETDNNNHIQSTNMCDFRDDVFNILSKTKPTQCNSEKNGNEKDFEVEDKNSGEKSNIHDFRDDIFKLLSKTKSQVCNNENNSNKKDIVMEEDAMNSKKDIVEITSNYENPNRSAKVRRKDNLNFFFLNGKGKKLTEIQFVASNLKNASARLLRILHYVLFGAYGPCCTGFQLSETKRNILLFCGYPFKRNSECYSKKKNCLLRLPFPILSEMYKVLNQKGCSTRSEMVAQLVDFFMEPKDEDDEREEIKDNVKTLSEEDYMYLKAIASKEPNPNVLLKKLNEEDIKSLQNQIKVENKAKSSQTGSTTDDPSYFLPAYILKGPGLKLKSFRGIVKRVHDAKSRVIETLQYILYGRMESVEACRRNILEFSGFLPCQKEFIAEREAMLNNMDHVEILQLCDILCLHCKTNTRIRKIRKILMYLSKPVDPAKYRRRRNNWKRATVVAPELRDPQNGNNRKKATVVGPELKDPQNGYNRKKATVVGPVLKDPQNGYNKKKQTVVRPKFCHSKNSYNEKKETAIVPKLRDFKHICSNIECASPSDLTELNDLLFIKPCDESEIHQRILEFTRFDFPISSIDYHYRKTLMHYMSFCIIKKIAQLLDIENRDKISNQDDLSSSILNFLMELKLPNSNSQKRGISKPLVVDKVVEKPKSHIVQIVEQKTEESWCLQKSSKSVINQKSSPDHPYSTEKNPISNQAIKKTQKVVVIHRLSKASLQQEDTPKANPLPADPLKNVENSIPLRALLHHPSDHELQQIITNIIKSDLWSITMGDLVDKVYQCYPDFNISYREPFIKTAARQIISQLRSNAVDTLNSIQLQRSDVI